MDDGGDGLITAGLGVVAGWALWKGGRWLWAGAAGGALVALVGFWDLRDVRQLADEINADTDYAAASVGAGLYLTVAAGVVLGLVCLDMTRSNDAVTVIPSETLPPPPMP